MVDATRRREKFDSYPGGDSIIMRITDPALAEELMRDRHLVSDQGEHYVVTDVLLMADTPGRAAATWSVRGRLERGDEVCTIGGEL